MLPYILAYILAWVSGVPNEEKRLHKELTRKSWISPSHLESIDLI